MATLHKLLIYARDIALIATPIGVGISGDPMSQYYRKDQA